MIDFSYLSSYHNALIKLGIEFNYKSRFESQLSVLTEEAKQRALTELQTSCENYKANLKMGLGEVTKEIKLHLNELQKIDSNQLERISTKFDEMIQTRQNKEAKFSFMERFFHRLGHLFHGHGFRTTAEWAQTVRHKLILSDEEVIKGYFKNLKWRDYVVQRIPENVSARLNKLSPEQIESYARTGIFNLDVLAEPLFGEDFYTTFVTLFTEDEKKRALLKGICSRPDSLIILNKITLSLKTGNIRQLAPFLPTEKLAESVIALYADLSSSSDPSKRDWPKHIVTNLMENSTVFKQYLAEAVVQHYVDKSDHQSLIQILTKERFAFHYSSLGLYRHIEQIQSGIATPIILNNSHMEFLNRTFKVPTPPTTNGEALRRPL